MAAHHKQSGADMHSTANLHFLLSRHLKKPQIQLYLIPFCSRVLHWLAAAGGHGGAGRVPLRPLHPRPQRQRQGGLQPRGQEVGQIYCIYFSFSQVAETHIHSIDKCSTQISRFPDCQWPCAEFC